MDGSRDRERDIKRFGNYVGCLAIILDSLKTIFMFLDCLFIVRIYIKRSHFSGIMLANDDGFGTSKNMHFDLYSLRNMLKLLVYRRGGAPDV